MEEKIAVAIRKNILFSILILLVIFIVDNRSYLFDYLPFQEDYEKVVASIDYGMLRHHYVRVNVILSEENTVEAKVKSCMGEGNDYLEEIVVGYSESREPAVVRVNPVVTSGFIFVAVALVLGNISYVRRIEKHL